MKTKLSTATPKRDKTIHCQGKRRIKHPASNVAAESFFFRQSPLGFRQVDPHALLACNMFYLIQAFNCPIVDGPQK